MYHYHILGLDCNETIRKIYEKQKSEPLKGDWIELLKTDFQFMEIEFDEEEIRRTPKHVYRKKIKDLIRKAALKELNVMKSTSSKIKDLKYEELRTQQYLMCPKFNNSERNLLYALRSRMYPAKNNFKKMHYNSLKCSLGCIANEDQFHIFQQCEVLKSNQNNNLYNNIFEDSDKQKDAISVYISIEHRRQQLIQCADSNL